MKLIGGKHSTALRIGFCLKWCAEIVLDSYLLRQTNLRVQPMTLRFWTALPPLCHAQLLTNSLSFASWLRGGVARKLRGREMVDPPTRQNDQHALCALNSITQKPVDAPSCRDTPSIPRACQLPHSESMLCCQVLSTAVLCGWCRIGTSLLVCPPCDVIPRGTGRNPGRRPDCDSEPAVAGRPFPH